MTDFERGRRAMVDNQLRTSGITDRRILGAMGALPRELFVPEARRSLAYIDDVHVLEGPSGRALAAPAPFARLLQLAEIEAGHSVLDVGVGTGYSAAVIARLAGSVTGVEEDAALVEAAKANLESLGISNVAIVQGPPLAGAPKAAPFDVILVEGSVSRVPDALLRQLRQGGRLVALVRNGAAAVVNVFVRFGDEFAPRSEFNTSLPPLVRETAPVDFVF